MYWPWALPAVVLKRGFCDGKGGLHEPPCEESPSRLPWIDGPEGRVGYPLFYKTMEYWPGGKGVVKTKGGFGRGGDVRSYYCVNRVRSIA